jgi:hypothetical protein
MVGRATATVLAALLAVGLLAPAVGARDDEVRRRGACDLGSEWRLIVRREDPSTLRVRYVIATERAGQTWSVFLSMNGTSLFAGTKTTNADGYIRITRFPRDRAGDDTISGSANKQIGGESCRGSLVFPS